MMVHPAPLDVLRPRVSATAHFTVRYTGRESHAAAAPQLGINAADALVIAQVAIGLLRQHLRATDQVHGIVTHGGEAANIIPAHTDRRLDGAGAHDRRARAVQASDRPLLPCRRARDGCDARARRRCSRVLAHGARRRSRRGLSRRRGRRSGVPTATETSRSRPTWATCRWRCRRSIRASRIDTAGAVNHQPEFAAACVNASADRAVVEGALGLALTAIARVERATTRAPARASS